MQLSVSGWDSKKEDGATDKCENSTVILDQTNVTPSKFIDYLFYRGHGLTDLSALTPVDLDVILESAGKEDFTLVRSDGRRRYSLRNLYGRTHYVQPV